MLLEKHKQAKDVNGEMTEKNISIYVLQRIL